MQAARLVIEDRGQVGRERGDGEPAQARDGKEGALTSGMVKSFLLFDISGQFYFVFVLLVFTVAFHFVSDW